MRIRIRDPDLFDPEFAMEKFVSGINIPDPQHWSFVKIGHALPLSSWSMLKKTLIFARLIICYRNSADRYLPTKFTDN
jgi:hypothetical protein